MLECGFEDQVGEISRSIRRDRQCLFFSATWPPQVKSLAAKMCLNGSTPVHLTCGQSGHGAATTREDIVQEVVVFEEPTWEERDRSKQELLYAHLREVLADPRHKVLVFVSRKNLCDEMVNRLWGEGFPCQTMHGGRTQDSRLSTLAEFRQGKLQLLITTNVMGRGLDIPDISHVVVYDMGDIEEYVHRIGRTARGPYGKGHALTFFEYEPRYPEIAVNLVNVLVQANQEVPKDLAKLVNKGKGKGGGK